MMKSALLIFLMERTTREVTVRPLKQSGIYLLGKWLNEQTWEEVFKALHHSTSQIALEELFHIF